VVYAVTGETFNRWDVEAKENPEKPVSLMNAQELKALSESGYVEIGGHTVSHPHLNTLSPDMQEAEIKNNKDELENLLSKPLTSFAYPYGSLDVDSKKITEKLGYQFAVATDSGPNAAHQDPYHIRRIAVFPKTTCFGLWRKINGNYVFRKDK
ncbi:polysaccharide deacetylase family protein, partial [Vibrio tubiashii]